MDFGGSDYLSVEYAASNRSTCKACKEKILKGALRIGTNMLAGDYEVV